MDGLPVSQRPDGSPHYRNTPTVFNVAFDSAYNWDGVAYTLENHADRIIRTLMQLRWEEAIRRLQADSAYSAAFKQCYADGITRANVLDALAAFERSPLTPDSQFDKFLRRQRDALTGVEARGYELFKRYGCVSCHQGVNLGGNLFQKFGVFKDVNANTSPADLGRFRVTHVTRDKQVFRVPRLRNVVLPLPIFMTGGNRSSKRRWRRWRESNWGEHFRRTTRRLSRTFFRP